MKAILKIVYLLAAVMTIAGCKKNNLERNKDSQFSFFSHMIVGKISRDDMPASPFVFIPETENSGTIIIGWLGYEINNAAYEIKKNQLIVTKKGMSIGDIEFTADISKENILIAKFISTYNNIYTLSALSLQKKESQNLLNGKTFESGSVAGFQKVSIRFFQYQGKDYYSINAINGDPTLQADYTCTVLSGTVAKRSTEDQPLKVGFYRNRKLEATVRLKNIYYALSLEEI